jgi:hypothetical protein
VDFIDEAVQRYNARRSAEKAKQDAENREWAKQRQKLQSQVDECISKVIYPILDEAKNKFSKNKIKAKSEVFGYTYAHDGKYHYDKAVLHLFTKTVAYNKNEEPVKKGPLIKFKSSPPYDTRIEIQFCDEDGKSFLNENCEIAAITREQVEDYLRQFVEIVFRE